MQTTGARTNTVNQPLKSQTLDHCGFNKQIIIATVINTVGWAITEKNSLCSGMLRYMYFKKKYLITQEKGVIFVTDF